MAANLTTDAIATISNPDLNTDAFNPVLQVTDVRLLQTLASASGENKERYRLVLSDGSFCQQGMLNTSLNELVTSQQIQKGAVVQLTKYLCNVINGRTLIIIVELNVIIDTCDIIGSPKPFQPKPAGNETSSMERSAAPMQSSLNQPATTFTRPNTNVGPPVHTRQSEYNPSLHSYENARPFAPVQSYINQPASTVTRPNTNVGLPGHIPRSEPNAGVYSYNSSFNNNSANNSMHSARPAFNQVPSMYGGNRGPTAKNEASERVIPIAALNPYQGKWTIKARVTAKSELRHYRNAKGEGKVFSFDLLDSDGGEIRATCFNAVADQYYNQLEPGKVYYISRGTIKPAQKAFNHLKHDNEITLDQLSTVRPCFDDDKSIPCQQFHFRSIGEIEGMDNNTILDIIGVVYGITPSTSIMTKNQTETQKRVLSLKDDSGRSIDLTLWGNFCNADGQTIQTMLDSGEFPVLAVKSARVHEFNGKSIGTISSSQLCIEPDFPEARKLKDWFNSVGRNTPSVSMSRESVSRTDRKTLSQIKDDNLGTSEKPDWITVDASIWHFRTDNFYYTACPIMIGDRKCSKKVVNNGDGKWLCEKCNKTVDECDYRYILQIQILDHTGVTWATAFQETGEEIMGIPAKDLYFIKHEEQNEDKFTEIVRNALFNRFSFKLKVKEESYGDDQRTIKSTIVKAEKMNFSSHTKHLLLELEKAQRNEDPSSVGLAHGVSPQIGTVGQPTALPASYVGRPAALAASHVGQPTALPASHVGHYGSQYDGSGGRMNGGVPFGDGSSGPSNECFKCHQTGHWARDCPGATNAPSYGGVSSGGGNSGPSKECFKCHQTGHWARDCPGVTNAPSYGGVPSGGGSSGPSNECFKCHQVGHWARDCPGVTSVPSYGGY